MNPFKYGTVVADRYFIDREKEIARIKDDLLNGINIILYAPRRYGKTSLVMQILNDLKTSQVKTVYQRSVLHAFLQEQENIFSKEYTQKHGLSSVSSTQRALKRLEELEIIEKIEDKYVFSDPFFPIYLRQRTFGGGY